MGVTIFYKGRLKPNIDRDLVIDIIQDIAGSLGWEREYFSDDEDGLKGVFLNPHADCESLDFIFNSSGLLVNLFIYGWNVDNKVEPIIDSTVKLCFCKTQFSNPATHITIIKFLTFLKKNYFKKLEIVDDGGYYPNSDTDELIHRMDLINEGIDILEETLNNAEIMKSSIEMRDDQTLVDRIEEILRNAFVKWKKKRKDSS
jgi:hypothetical protein